MSGDQPEVLSVRVEDRVKMSEIFGKGKKPPKGVAATLHLTDPAISDRIMSVAWKLTEETGLPVVIIVRKQ